ncbi:MAG: glucosidase [Candidatus Rokubacteria bacterium]|nr:glucosidase [Candidatus Rokubacteria bacterium]
MGENVEEARLREAREGGVAWRQWGPYLSERQWGTVREDYSADGNAWDHFSHDQARSRAYRWGEDGLGGLSDDKQRLCFALALWNGADPILKERLFGLTNSEGNHGEDVKEYYFYVDSTPTHSYMKYLYKYPQSAYPYRDLVQTNRERSRLEPEYELLDTGLFDDDRYWDVIVEYAKATPDDILIRITAENRGPAAATLHLLPTLWFRNTWAGSVPTPRDRPQLRAVHGPAGTSTIAAAHPELGERHLTAEGAAPLLFTENETNTERLWGTPSASRYVKDAFHRYVVHGEAGAVNPARVGTKAAAHYRLLDVPPGQRAVIRLRLAPAAVPAAGLGDTFDDVLRQRRQEADEFYASITPPEAGADGANVLRQALAGMLWSKQYYYFDLDPWLGEHGVSPSSTAGHLGVRNRQWFHMVNDDVISMPDKWEYPWYAAWDLAFHTIALAAVDLDFAKDQLDLMLRELYLHPSGQIPAYEWNFGDVNPPVHAWATLHLYHAEKGSRENGDVAFLERSFRKLLFNFTWWVNRKDPIGRNVFEGGFLGLDNIGVFDRSSPLPTGGYLEQADGTAWMALYCQNMLDIAIELSRHDEQYLDMATKFLEHFLWIASAMDRMGANEDEMWDEEDGFFYDLLRLPDGRASRLKVRSMVGLLPLCATTVFQGEVRERHPAFMERAGRFLRRNPELTRLIAPPERPGVGGRYLLAIASEDKLRRILARMLDENEFLSPYGIRALSRYHRDHPYVFTAGHGTYRVDYEPAESTSGMFGGNSNWRGPIWFPVNALIFRALLQFHAYYGDAFTVECPTGSGTRMNLFEVAQELARRQISIFLRDGHGRRPVYGGTEKFQSDPHWRDLILFYEYFHGDNGAGIGASHQTGWTGVVARLIQMMSMVTGQDILESGVRARLLYRR